VTSRPLEQLESVRVRASDADPLMPSDDFASLPVLPPGQIVRPWNWPSRTVKSCRRGSGDRKGVQSDQPVGSSQTLSAVLVHAKGDSTKAKAKIPFPRVRRQSFLD
jgi:hypothetical protein